MFQFYDALYERLTQKLTVITSTLTEPVKRLAEALYEIQVVLKELREKALSEPFASRQAEISFFKTIKPKFYALRVYHMELYHLDMGKPAGTVDMLMDYYRAELKQVQRFFQIHAFHYQYFRTGFSEMDNLYFVRGAELPNVWVPEMPDIEPEFSTAMDYLFSRFMAYELLQAELLKRIQGLDGTQVAVANVPVKPAPQLKWTGSHVNLVELIYGLYHTLQLNGGEADISQIVSVMEATFGVKLRDAHHSFVEIRRRKIDSPARFLEQMAAAIRQRVEDDLEYKPGRK